MRLLLDTHSFLWYIEDDDRLSQTAEQTISDIDNEVLQSIGSLWEIAIKYGIGKLSLCRVHFGEFFSEQLLVNKHWRYYISHCLILQHIPNFHFITVTHSTVCSLPKLW